MGWARGAISRKQRESKPASQRSFEVLSANACILVHGLVSAVAIYRMGNRSGAKIRGKWERTWKMAPGLKWPKNGHRDGKMGPKRECRHFVSIFSIPAAIFWAISGRGPIFHVLSHFPPDFCTGPVSFCRWPPQTQSWTLRASGVGHA